MDKALTVWVSHSSVSEDSNLRDFNTMLTDKQLATFRESRGTFVIKVNSSLLLDFMTLNMEVLPKRRWLYRSTCCNILDDLNTTVQRLYQNFICKINCASGRKRWAHRNGVRNICSQVKQSRYRPGVAQRVPGS